MCIGNAYGRVMATARNNRVVRVTTRAWKRVSAAVKPAFRCCNKVMRRNQWKYLVFGFLAGVAVNSVFHRMHDVELLLRSQNMKNDAVVHDEAQELKEKVRILCMIMTHPENHMRKAVHVKATWGKRCNIMLFMSTAHDPSIPTVQLNISEGRQGLWTKTRTAFQLVHDRYLNEADWFLKADDDTYIVVENLRYMLRNHSTEEAVWFGCNFKEFGVQGYTSGGAGYVLSREAVRRFVTKAMPDNSLCSGPSGVDEDVEMGKCLASVNATAGDSRDEKDRYRFFPFDPEHFVGPFDISHEEMRRPGFWFWNFIKYPFKHGPNCCSTTAVSFHYISPIQLYVLDYLIYRLKPYGVKSHDEDDRSDVIKPVL